MTPADFIAKWSKVQLTERAAAQPHFLDLCSVLGQEPPAQVDPTGEWFCFEKGASKQDGGEGWADVWKKGFFGWEYKGKKKDLDVAYRQLLQYREALENPPLLVVCDLDRIVVRTNFTGSRAQVHEIRLARLGEPHSLEILRAVFFEPDRLRPGNVNPTVTQEAARSFGALAQALRERGLEPRRVARFLDRLVFCLFAEDVGILPGPLLARVLEQTHAKPELFPKLSGNLFREMASGGFFGADKVPHVNGSLFDDAESLELLPAELDLLLQASRLDWSAIDPSILGTLFERGLDPAKRSQLGAHYTSRDDIETLVEPVVMAPLRREWEEACTTVDRLLATGRKDDGPAPAKALSPAQAKKAREEAWLFVERFLRRLETVTVLDPACGSGNFLYVTLWKLKDLEAKVYDDLLEKGFQAPLRVGVGPWQLYGIEINPYAHELAQLTVWIGYLQWQRLHGTTAWKEPILQAMSNIENKDAILDQSDPDHPKEPTWPKAEFIVGNPPFLGGKMLRRELGDDRVDALFHFWADRVPAEADLCCYWFEKAKDEIRLGRGRRAGLLATQGIRGGANREVLKHIKEAGDIFWAESDRPWVLDGANVHVSMVGFDAGAETSSTLNGILVTTIHANLRADVETTAARPLRENQGVAFQGPVKVGAFEVAGEVAGQMLASPNPHGRPSSDVLVPWLNGLDVTRRPRGMWIIDFGTRPEAAASLYEQPFEHVGRHVAPERKKNADRQRRENWWRLGRSGSDWKGASQSLNRAIFTARVAKHRLFVWLASPTLPDTQVVAFAREDDTFFGILHSRAHEVWALAQGTQLEDRPRYTPTTCFETFPFPYPEVFRAGEIAAAAKELDEQRSRWLNPPEWVKEEMLEFPGAVDGPWARYVVDADARGIGTVRWPRLVPRDGECAGKLAKRTLTNLYNERPAWLDLAHRRLDEAVFAAYDWQADLSDEELLEKLLALNLERARTEGGN